MPTVQVRDFPQTLFERLQLTAEREHRSVPQQVIAITEAYVDGSLTGSAEGAGQAVPKRSQREELFATLKAAAPALPRTGKIPSAAELVREDRDNR